MDLDPEPCFSQSSTNISRMAASSGRIPASLAVREWENRSTPRTSRADRRRGSHCAGAEVAGSLNDGAADERQASRLEERWCEVEGSPDKEATEAREFAGATRPSAGLGTLDGAAPSSPSSSSCSSGTLWRMVGKRLLSLGVAGDELTVGCGARVTGGALVRSTAAADDGGSDSEWAWRNVGGDGPAEEDPMVKELCVLRAGLRGRVVSGGGSNRVPVEGRALNDSSLPVSGSFTDCHDTLLARTVDWEGPSALPRWLTCAGAPATEGASSLSTVSSVPERLPTLSFSSSPSAPASFALLSFFAGLPLGTSLDSSLDCVVLACSDSRRSASSVGSRQVVSLVTEW
mmetsp:Transcript_16965/g.49436  ORF Transcript_16965/g.49436 Transcript_16965/m.49436 type:complete len:345 (-) Transcript_16965:603-1637(-)